MMSGMLGLEPVVQAYLAWAIERRGRLDLEALAAVWPIAMGATWARYTRPYALAGGRLEVEVPDGVWMAELHYQAPGIVARLNRMLPAGVPRIETLRSRVGSGGWPQAPVAAPPPTVNEGALLAEHGAALENIGDAELRRLVGRVVRRTAGRSDRAGGRGEGESGT
jgi:hypothetical protein